MLKLLISTTGISDNGNSNTDNHGKDYIIHNKIVIIISIVMVIVNSNTK